MPNNTTSCIAEHYFKLKLKKAIEVFGFLQSLYNTEQ